MNRRTLLAMIRSRARYVALHLPTTHLFPSEKKAKTVAQKLPHSHPQSDHERKSKTAETFHSSLR